MKAKPKKEKEKIPEWLLWSLGFIAIAEWLFAALLSLFGLAIAEAVIGLTILAAASVIGFLALIGFFRSLMRK